MEIPAAFFGSRLCMAPPAEIRRSQNLSLFQPLHHLDPQVKVIVYLGVMSESKDKAKTGGFFQRLLDSFFKNSDPELEKKRVMKMIAKELSKTKYKFYKPNTEEVLPAFAKTFFTIYKTVVPGRIYFQANANPKLYQRMVLNAMMTEKHLDLVDQLSEESILSDAKSMSVGQLKVQVKERSDALFSFFDANMINRIDTLYSQLMLFKAFCEYDYFFMLKKFDSSLKENDFSTTPQFEAITGKYIVDDLKDFLSIASSLMEFDNWNDLFVLLKKIKDVEPVSKGAWTRLMNRLQDMQASRVFDMMLQLVQQNPAYATTPGKIQEHITEKYIDNIRQEAEKTVSRIQTEQKSSKIDSLVNSIFGTTSIVRMKHYTEDQSGVYERRNIGSFSFQQPMNYMKAFLLDYVKKDVREVADLVLVRGKWSTTTLSTPMSEAYHKMLDLSDKIIEFDDTLADGGATAGKLKNLLSRCDRDKEALNIIRTILKDINSSARDILVAGTQDIIVFARNLKLVLEDYAKPHPGLVINWKELEHYADYNIKDSAVAVYKKLHLFVTLMQGFLANNEI